VSGGGGWGHFGGPVPTAGPSRLPLQHTGGNARNELAQASPKQERGGYFPARSLLWLPGCGTSAAKGRGHRRVASPETSGITGLVSGRTTPHGSGGNEATGEVDSHSKRARAEKVASAILNVQQVVNELQVKRQKASSSK